MTPLPCGHEQGPSKLSQAMAVELQNCINGTRGSSAVKALQRESLFFMRFSFLIIVPHEESLP